MNTYLYVHAEAHLITGSDGVSLGLGSDVRVEAALVADHVVRGDIRNGRVGVCRLADILVGVGDVAVDNESLEVVVSQGSDWEGGDDGQDGRERSAHVGLVFKEKWYLRE
jgi:hypothetical protein